MLVFIFNNEILEFWDSFWFQGIDTSDCQVIYIIFTEGIAYKIAFPIKQTLFIRHRQTEKFIFKVDGVGAQLIIQVGVEVC